MYCCAFQFFPSSGVSPFGLPLLMWVICDLLSPAASSQCLLSLMHRALQNQSWPWRALADTAGERLPSELTFLSEFDLFLNLRLFFLFSHLSVPWKDLQNPLSNILKDFVRRMLFRIPCLPHCPNIFQMLFLMFLL